MLTGEANELQLLDLRFGAASRHAPTWGNSNELDFVKKISGLGPLRPLKCWTFFVDILAFIPNLENMSNSHFAV